MEDYLQILKRVITTDPKNKKALLDFVVLKQRLGNYQIIKQEDLLDFIDYIVELKEDEDILNAYLEAASWTADESMLERTDVDYSEAKFLKESIEDAQKDINNFLEEAAEYLFYDELANSNLKQIGHDFWLSRNGHGSGFFDGEYEYPDHLQEIARNFGEKYIELVHHGNSYAWEIY